MIYTTYKNAGPAPAKPWASALGLKVFLGVPARTHTILFLSLLTGCTPVKPWQRERLADPIMQPTRNPLGSAQLDHVHFSREAATPSSTISGGGVRVQLTSPMKGHPANSDQVAFGCFQPVFSNAKQNTNFNLDPIEPNHYTDVGPHLVDL